MANPTFQQIQHVAINVTNIAASKRFYGEALGLAEIPRPDTFNFKGAWYRLGPTDLHLIERDEGTPRSSPHFALWSSDVRAAAAMLQKAGHEVKWETMKIPHVDRFFTRDPDGNRIEIMGSDGTRPADPNLLF